jgi:RNA polymerase sigma-70 factor (subfamily 1)
MARDDQGKGVEMERFQPYLKWLARKELSPRLRRHVDLSGLVQKTLLEALMAWERFRRLSEAKKKPWLRKALLNNLRDVVDALFSEGRNIEKERSLEEAPAGSSQPLKDLLASEQSTPSQKAMRNEQAFRLAAALGQLSADRRRAVELRLKGFKLAEMAQQMGKNVAAVAQLLSRGIKDLHALLGQEGKDHQP